MQYQARLGRALLTLFPEHDIIENARKTAGVVASERTLELDYWIPALHIAFEYQDPYHYSTTWYHTSLNKVKRNDDIKNTVVNARAETLIIVPCWWDGRLESLVATITSVRPDLRLHNAPDFNNFHLAPDFNNFNNTNNNFENNAPIPQSPTMSFFDEHSIPGVGELMLASFMDGNHGGHHGEANDISKWWLSEKYDGFRACWNPASKKLYSRFSREVYLKFCFNTLFPAQYLDGELWFGRGAFLETCKLLAWGQRNNLTHGISWHLLRMSVFDSPSVEQQCSPMETRFENLVWHVPYHHPFLVPIANIVGTRQKEETHLNCSALFPQQHQSLLAHVLNDQGEGIVLRAPSSVYQPGRSNLWLKRKVLRDQEALVLDIVPVPQVGITTHNNSYVLLLPQGSTCTALAADDRLHVQRGDVVTFSYATYEKQYSTPGQCCILRKRPDLSWDDVLFLHHRELRIKKGTLDEELSSAPLQASTRKPPGFWSICDNPDDTSPSNLRRFFDKFASSKNMDGTIPENWFSFTKCDLLQEKGGASILRQYSSSMRLALAAAYPDSIGLVADDVAFRLGFHKLPSKFWEDSLNRKQFLHNVALRRQLNPNVMGTWERISEADIKKERGGTSFMHFCTHHYKDLLSVVGESFFNGQVTLHNYQKLKHTIPPLPDPTRKASAREYFKTVAAGLGFDYQISSYWYEHFPFVNGTVLGDQCGIQIASWYGSVSKALTALFPELNLVQAMLVSALNVHEKQGMNLLKTREFFETVSQKLCFDPLLPENWYPISHETILSFGVLYKKLNLVEGITSKLQLAFPEVHFEYDKFLYIK